MNQRNKYLQYIASGILFLAIAFGIYWQGSNLHRSVASLEALTSQSTSTVTISAERLAELETQAATGRRLLQERQTALTDLGNGTTSSATTTINTAEPHEARVIGRPPQSPYDTLVLDVGNDSGVQLGAGVWWSPGVYLGEVVDVRERTAVVELISSDGVRHPVFIAGVPVLAEGRGGGELYAEIPQTVAVSVGATVTSDVYKMPVGVVAAVNTLTTTDQQALYISRFISSEIIETVYVEG